MRVAAVLLAVGVFLGSWALLDRGFYREGRLIDTPTYERIGDAIRAGEMPYRDVRVEYPPGALPTFVAPTFFDDYGDAFALLMAACGVLCVLFFSLARPPPWGLAFLAVSPLLVGSLVLSRFDLWPAALCAAAFAALLRDRHRLGWAALGAGFAAKVYPAVLIPLAVVWTLRRGGGRELGRAAAAGLAVAGAAFVPFLVLAPGGLWASLREQLERPLQIESLAASFATTFAHPEVVGSHGSINIVGYGRLGAVFGLAGALTLLVLWVAFARGPADSDRLARYAAACVCTFIVFGKVLSPQYLIWLLPLVPLVRGRRGLVATAVLGAALVATQTWFPVHYWDYVYEFDRAWVVLLRNLVLVALVCVLFLTPPGRARARSA
jgi:uncharacterized membrane protein